MPCPTNPTPTNPSKNDADVKDFGFYTTHQSSVLSVAHPSMNWSKNINTHIHWTLYYITLCLVQLYANTNVTKVFCHFIVWMNGCDQENTNIIVFFKTLLLNVHLMILIVWSPDDLSYMEHALEKICRPDLVTQIMDFRAQLGTSEENNQEISGPARKYKGN